MDDCRNIEYVLWKAGRRRERPAGEEGAMSDESIKEIVKQKYALAALRVTGGDAACCGPSSECCGSAASADPITSNLYDAGQISALPSEAVAASLGCGNPTALAELRPGEIVLDLGSGGGIDVLLSARRAVRGLGRRGPRIGAVRDPQERRAVDRLCRGGAGGPGVPGEAHQGRVRGDRPRADSDLPGGGRPRVPRP